MFSLAHPHYLWLLTIIPVYWAYTVLVLSRRQVRIEHPDTELIRKAAGGNTLFRYLPVAVRSLILLLLTVALAQPRWGHRETEITGEGVDIMLALDCSRSMETTDFLPNRLEAAKKVAEEFVQHRPHDRIGMVTFSGTAYTQCPLTLDAPMLLKVIRGVKLTESMDGTAIGMGLGMAANRLSQSQAKSKVIILITDGNNNTGAIDPIEAANLAAGLGIKVYPIGVGTRNPYAIPGYLIEPLDMEPLNQIAQMTGTGQAHLATNSEELEMIISNIDHMEKSSYSIKHHNEYRELFPFLLVLAMLLLLGEALGRVLRWRVLP